MAPASSTRRGTRRSLPVTQARDGVDAAPALERLVKRKPKDDPYEARRRAVAARVLARC